MCVPVCLLYDRRRAGTNVRHQILNRRSADAEVEVGQVYVGHICGIRRRSAGRRYMRGTVGAHAGLISGYNSGQICLRSPGRDAIVA